MKIDKLYFIIGIPIILIVLLIIYGYNLPQQNEHEKISLIKYKKIINSNEYVLVYFNASWCMACIKMKPIIDGIEMDYKKIKILRVNTDDSKELSDKFEINSLPVLILYHNGSVVWQEIRAMSSLQLRSKLE